MVHRKAVFPILLLYFPLSDVQKCQNYLIAPNQQILLAVPASLAQCRWDSSRTAFPKGLELITFRVLFLK